MDLFINIVFVPEKVWTVLCYQKSSFSLWLLFYEEASYEVEVDYYFDCVCDRSAIRFVVKWSQ